jgi:hypothetical protein
VAHTVWACLCQVFVGLEERMVKVNVYIRRKRANVGDGTVSSFPFGGRGWVS